MKNALDTAYDSLRNDWNSFIGLIPRLVLAVVLFLVLVWIGRMVGRALVRVLEEKKFNLTHRNFFRHLTTWLFALLGLIIAMNLLGLQAAAAGLMAGGGITAVALGFAFRGIGENLLAGFFLAFSRPFEVGDVIQSGEFQGAVRGIEMRSTHIRTGDGRDVYIPSSQIFNLPVVNFTRDGLRRLSFMLGIDYQDNTAEARRLLLQAVGEVDQVLPDPGPAVNISSFQSQYQEVEVSFWIDTFQAGADLAGTRFRVMDRCRNTLRESGFTFSSEVTTGVVLDAVPGAATRAGKDMA
jgi:small-conductance mechanosensitive channel